MSSLPLWDEPPKDRSASPESPVLTVSELTSRIQEALESGFSRIAVRGEITNLSRPRSGHVYFSLKDAAATIRAVLWKTDARAIRFDMHDGLAVTAFGKLAVYPPQGVYQVVVRRLEPVGIGALELAFRQMAERLRAEGLFETARKRPLPSYPRRIVLITSPTGAAVRDFLQTAAKRWPASEILVAPARMQGTGSADEVVRAISLANRAAGAELIAIVRGGGSMEDLWTFNEERVARSIHGSRLPVVTGIGHEVDVTIADLVADVRGLTPTDAAVHALPDRVEVAAAVAALGDRLARGLRYEAQRARIRLDRLADRLRGSARDSIRRADRRLDPLAARLENATRRDLERRAESLAALAGRLDALSPLSVLARGYSLTLAVDGQSLLRDARTVRAGDLIRTRLARGSILSRVEQVEA